MLNTDRIDIGGIINELNNTGYCKVKNFLDNDFQNVISQYAHNKIKETGNNKFTLTDHKLDSSCFSDLKDSKEFNLVIDKIFRSKGVEKINKIHYLFAFSNINKPENKKF